MLSLEAETLSVASSQLDGSFARAVEIIEKALSQGGKIVVSGVGKSGNVAKKVAATLTSTGSMAVFLHPTDALHGDLGILCRNDVFLLFSHSGSTEELLELLPAVHELCSGRIGVLGNQNGALARGLDVVIPALVPMEACPNNLAPTTSSTLQMAMGDALAMCLQKLVGFSSDSYARFHPGGALGKRASASVGDLMHDRDAIGLLSPTAKIEDVVMALTDYRQSGVCIVKNSQEDPELLGVIVEGDIRRALSAKEKFFSYSAEDVMNKNPTTVQADMKAVDALEVMQSRDHQISFLPVVDSDGKCVGALRLHDLVLSGLT